MSVDVNAAVVLVGYAALFGVPDQAGDVVRRGAFRNAIGRELPLLVRHDARLLAGRWTRLVEDARGLFVEGALHDDAPAAGVARRLLAAGVDGLSIGFVARAARITPTGRDLIAVDLLEISLVPTPMQTRARLTRIASAPLKETA